MTYLEMYDLLRQAHSSVKDITNADDYDTIDELMKTAIDGVHSALYMAEHRAIEIMD